MSLSFRTTSDFLDDPFVGAAVKRLNEMEERLQFLRESNRNAAGQMSADEHRKRRARARELSNDIKRRRKFLEVLETQSLEKSEARKGFRRSVNVATSRAVGRATRSLGQQAARRGLEDSEALQAGAAAQVQAAGAAQALTLTNELDQRLFEAQMQQRDAFEAGEMGYVMNMQQIANSQDFQFRMAEFNRDVQSDLLNQQLWGQAGLTLLNNLTQPGILFAAV